MYVCKDDTLIYPMLKLYKEQVRLQTKLTLTELHQEQINLDKVDFDNLDPTEEETKKTFLEMLLSGEIDFDKQS